MCSLSGGAPLSKRLYPILRLFDKLPPAACSGSPLKEGAFWVSAVRKPPSLREVASRSDDGRSIYSSQMAVAPQGTTPPVAETGRPISSQLVCPPKRGTSVVLSMYSITAGDRPVV